MSEVRLSRAAHMLRSRLNVLRHSAMKVVLKRTFHSGSSEQISSLSNNVDVSHRSSLDSEYASRRDSENPAMTMSVVTFVLPVAIDLRKSRIHGGRAPTGAF